MGLQQHDLRDATERDRGSDGWRCGRIGGVPIHVSPWMLVMSGLLAYLFAPVVEWWLPGIGVLSYVVALSLPAALLLSVLAHELGHLLMGRLVGLAATRITLGPLGGATEFGEDARTPGREAILAAGGPVVSLLLAGVGTLWEDVAAPVGLVGVLLNTFATLNLTLAVFNLLPGLPLDGGHLLRAAAWRLSGDPVLAVKVAGWAGRVLAVAVIAVPIVRLAVGTPLGIFLDAVFLLVGVTIWTGAAEGLREARPSLPGAGQLCRSALPVAGYISVAEAVAAAWMYGVRALVVVDDEHRPVAVVNEAALSAIPVPNRESVAVSAVARTIEPDTTIPADLGGQALVERLRRGGASEYLVVDSAGSPVGVLAVRDLENAG